MNTRFVWTILGATALAGTASLASAQGNPVVVRRDTVVVVHQDTVVHSRADTAVVTTTVSNSNSAPAAAGSMSLAATLVQLPNYKTLVSLLEATHLMPTLRGAAKMTIFAPTDEAFSKLPAGALESLRADSTALRKLLLNHVVSGAIDTREVLKLKTATTLEGSRIRFGYTGGRPTVNDIPIVQPGIIGNNGFIYGIAGVINAPTAP